MKKLVLAFVAVAAISFASCGNTQKPAQNADTTKVDTTAQVDTAQVDTAAAAAADTTAQK